MNDRAECERWNAVIAARGASAEPGLAEHLAGCEECRDLAGALRSPTLELSEVPDAPRGHANTVPSSTCAEVQGLIELGLSSLEGEQEQATLAHLATCDDCMRLATGASRGALDTIVDERARQGTDDFPELHVIEPDNYVRAEEIGRGGMGRIVRARDRRLGRAVAIKELLDPRLRPRFEQEARLTARLQHPAIVHVHEAGRWPGGGSFYAMKDVAGQPLDRAIAGKRSLGERLALLPNLVTVIEAIAYAHSLRVIHRDLKPANILIGPFGETVVIDWGLAKDLSRDEDGPVEGPYREDGSLTVAGAGTPSYMPPEQARGEGASERCDVYALGATLYHLLAGKPPYGDREAREVIALLRAGAPPPILEVEPATPPALATIVNKAMARDPAGRYASAGELAEELRRFQTGQLVKAHAYSPADLLRRFVRRNRLPLAVAAAALVVLAVMGGAGVARIVRERAAAERALAALYEEQGRRELADGRPQRAAAYLAEAYAREPGHPGVEALTAAAIRPSQALEVRVQVATADMFDRGWLLRDGAILIQSRAGLSVRDKQGTRNLPVSGRAAVSPDGSFVVVMPDGESRAKDFLIWDVAEGNIRASLEGSGDAQHALICGDRIVTFAYRGSAQVWSPTNGELLHTLWVSDDNGPPMLAAFRGTCDRAGTRLLLGGLEGPAELWDLESGARIATIDDLSGKAHHAAFSPDGRHLAVFVGPDQKVLLHDGRTGARAVEIPKSNQVVSMAFAPDGRHLVLAGVPSSAVLETATWKRVADLPPAWRIGGDSFDPEGRILALCDGNGRTLLSDVEGGGELAVLDDGCTSERADRPVFSPDGAHILSSSSLTPGKREILTWSVAALGLPARVRPGLEHAGRIAVRPDGAQVAVISGEEARAHLVSLEGGAAVELPHAGDHAIWASAYSPDGRRFATSGKDLAARVFDTRTGALVATFSGHSAQINALAFSPDGRSLATASDDRTVKVWDLESGTARLTYTGQNVLLYALAFSPDGATVASGGGSRSVHIWDARTGERRAELGDHTAAVNELSFSPDGARLLSVDVFGSVRVWHDGKALRIVEGRGTLSLGRFAGFSPDGRRVAAVLADGSVEIFDAASGVLQSTFTPNSPFSGAAFSPDGAFLVTGCDARALCLWDVERGTRSLALHGLRDTPRWVAFSPDGTRVLAADHGIEVLSWPVGRERRPPAELTGWLTGRVPWTVVEGRLMQRQR